MRTARIADITGESLELRAGSTKPTRCSRSSGTGTGAQTQSGRDASSRSRPETTITQSSSPNSSPRSRRPSMTPTQPLPRRTGTQSEAEWTLAWALLGRAVEEDDRSAAERSRGSLCSKGRRRRCWGRCWNRRRRWTTSRRACSCSRTIRKGSQLRSARSRSSSSWRPRSRPSRGGCRILFTIGISLCGKGDADSGISLVSAARRMYREDGIAEWTIEQTIIGRSRRARGGSRRRGLRGRGSQR